MKLTLSTPAAQLFELFLLCNCEKQFLPLTEFRVLELLFESAHLTHPTDFKGDKSGLKFDMSRYRGFLKKMVVCGGEES